MNKNSEFDKICIWLSPIAILAIGIFISIIFPDFNNNIFKINVITTMGALYLFIFGFYSKTYERADNCFSLFIPIILLNVFVGYLMLGSLYTVKTEIQKLNPNAKYQFIKTKNSLRIFIDEKEYVSSKIDAYNKIESIKRENITIIKKYNSYGVEKSSNILLDGEEI